MVTGLLPSSVRYALTYNGGLIGQKEVADMLLPDIMLADEVVYLVTQALDMYPARQQKFLNELVSAALDKFNETLYAFLKNAAEELLDGVQVVAIPLAEMSWYGFCLGRRFEACVIDCWVSRISPILVGYTGAVGLVAAIRYGAPFYMVMPDWMGQRECCGYDFPMTPDDFGAHPLAADRIVEECEVLYVPGFHAEPERVRTYVESYGRGSIRTRSVLSA